MRGSCGCVMVSFSACEFAPEFHHQNLCTVFFLPIIDYSLLLVVWMHGWGIIYNSGLETFLGIYSLQDSCMIRSWKWSLVSLSCIPKE